jgi:hypothetical protein
VLKVLWSIQQVEGDRDTTTETSVLVRSTFPNFRKNRGALLKEACTHIIHTMVQFNSESTTPSRGISSASINATRIFFFLATIITITTTLRLLHNLEVSVSPKTSTLKIPSPPVSDGGGTVGSIICPSAMNLFANKTKLKEFIAKNVHYHRHGGNLESIDKYLNSHMQSSLDRLGLQFFPNNDSNKPVSNIAEYLKTYYQNNNVPRGGYGQPLPGKFSTDPESRHQALFENRWINVLEPSTMERFTAGIVLLALNVQIR